MQISGIKIGITYYVKSYLDNGWLLSIHQNKKLLKEITVKDTKDIMIWFEDQFKALFPHKRKLHQIFTLKS